MTRILVPRGGSSNSSNQNPGRSGSSLAQAEPAAATPQVPSASKDEESVDEVLGQVVGTSDSGKAKSDELLMEDLHLELQTVTPSGDDVAGDVGKKCVTEEEQELSGKGPVSEIEDSIVDSSVGADRSSQPPPPSKPSADNLNSMRNVSETSNAVHGGSPRKAIAWPVVSPAGSRPSSPRAHSESQGYNSADEHNQSFVSSNDDLEKERQFEIDIRRDKGYEVKRMLGDGNCLFRAVADQVYGDSESYDLVRQMCIDYMERERDHFSQYVTEGFTSYCKRKRRDKVFGDNVEIQAVFEMYNRPIHIYSYSTEPINIFQRSNNTDTPPIRLSYHRRNHYNSLVDPRRPTVGAGLGFSSLHGTNVDKDQVKAAIKAQQDQQINNALLAEGRFYSDLELTEKEIEQAVMEASRAEYLADGTFKQQLGLRESSTSNAEPSSSGATGSFSESKMEQGKEHDGSELSSSIQTLLSMGFSYIQAVEAYSIFGEDVDSMVCYLLETGTATATATGPATSSSRLKGKSAEDK